MEKPPPYEHSDKAPVAFSKHSTAMTATNSALPPKFHIRAPTKSDALGMFRVNEDVHTTLNATRDSPQPVSQIEASIVATSFPNIVQLVAVAPAQSKVRSGSISTLIHKLASHTIEKSNNFKPPEVMGYIHLIPFIAGGSSDIGRSCYDRTASLVMNTMSESVLGYELWRSVIIALVEEVCARAVEEGHRYNSAVLTISFREDQPSFVKHRNILLEAGFVEKGRLSEVVQKGELLLDRLYLQKAL